MFFRKYNGEECDSNEFLSLDSNISGKSTSSDNSASGKYLQYIFFDYLLITFNILKRRISIHRFRSTTKSH